MRVFMAAPGCAVFAAFFILSCAPAAPQGLPGQILPSAPQMAPPQPAAPQTGQPASGPRRFPVTLASKVIKNHIKPGYDRLASGTAALNEAMAAFCAAPGKAERAKVEAAFEEALIAWSRMENLRYGPVVTNNMFDRFAFWPDEKGLGLKQINAALAKKDGTVLSADTLRGKSVALQGFTALEFLLYGAGNETLLAKSPDGAFRCGFAMAIAVNLMEMAAEVAKGWGEEAGFSAFLIKPDPGHKLYKSTRDVKLELFKTFTTGLQLVRDVKLARVLADGPAAAQPRRASYWRSKLTFKVIAANLESLENYFNRGGFSELIAALQPGIEKSVALDLARMRQTVEALGASPVDVVVKLPGGWNKLNGVIFELVSVQQTGGGAIARASDISLGFNALDGD